MATGITMESIVIDIESNAGKAVTNVDKLATSLSNLRSSVKGGFGNLTKLKDALSGLSETASKMDTIAEQMGKISQVVEAMRSLNEIKSSGLRDAIGSLKNIPTVFSKIKPDTLRNITRVSDELGAALTPLAEKMGQIGQGYQALQRMADQYGQSAKVVTRSTKQSVSVLNGLASATKRVSSHFDKLVTNTKDFGSTALKQFKKVNSIIKQVGLSLLGTRTLFTAVRKAISEYMAMDKEMSESLANVWRALGALLAPAVEEVIYLFKQFARVVYSVIKAITGIDLIARANAKATASWGKSAKDTLGTLQKFDDLNVVEFPKSTGDDITQIDLKEIDLTPIQKLVDWIKKLKEEIKAAIDTGQWYNVGVVFAEGINEGIRFLLNNMGVVKNTVNEIFTNIGETLNGIIENVHWDRVGEFITKAIAIIPNALSSMLSTINWDAVGESINEFFKGFSPTEVVHSFMTVFGSIAIGLSNTLAATNWGSVAQSIGTAVATFFSDLSFILDQIKWEEIGTRVREAIENTPWDEIWTGVLNSFKSVFSGLGEFIDGVLGTNGFGSILVGASAILTVFSKLNGLTLIKNIGGLAKGFGNATKTATSLYDKGKLTFSLLGKNTLTTSSISGITGLSTGFTNAASGVSGLVSALGGLGPTVAIIGAVAVAIMAFVTAFKELYQTNEGFRQTVNELGEAIGNTFGTIIETAKEMLSKLFTVLKNLWENVLVPIFDLLVEVAKPIVVALIEVLKVLWENIIDPLVNLLWTGLKFAWDQVCISLEATIAVLNPVIKVLTWLWKNVLSPVVDFLLDIVVGAIKLVAEQIKKRIDFITNVIKTLSTFISTVWNTIKSVVGKIADWVYTNMISPLVEKFNKLKEKISDIWTGIWSTIKGVINKIISGVESLINTIIRGLNKIIKPLTQVGNTILGAIGIDNFTFKTISEVSLPRLETGTNEIPYEGLYHLHPGEAVVPKKYNPALGGGTNNETNQKLDTLIAIMENMNFTNVVNIGNKKVYEGQQSFNKMQQNKYGTTNVY